MVSKIYKFRLGYSGRCEIQLPVKHEVLSVGEQNGAPYLWARVDPSTPLVFKPLICVTTGAEIEDDLVGKCYGGVSLQGGSYIIHVFESNV